MLPVLEYGQAGRLWYNMHYYGTATLETFRAPEINLHEQFILFTYNEYKNNRD